MYRQTQTDKERSTGQLLTNPELRTLCVENERENLFYFFSSSSFPFFFLVRSRALDLIVRRMYYDSKMD